MLIYEVNLDVDQEIEETYREWLGVHIREMLEIDGFQSAELFRRRPGDEPGGDPGRVGWTVHYRLSDRGALERYFSTEAPRMRADGIRCFGDRFAASRRILEIEEPPG